MKKFLAIALVMMLAVCAFVGCGGGDGGDNDPVASGTCGENLTWILYKNGTLTISGTGAMTDWDYYSDSVTPWDFPLSAIKKVVIENGVTTIEDGAFYDCDALTSVTMGNSVTTIGDDAFGGCDALTSVTMGNSVTTIEGWAFGDCGALTSVTMGSSVTAIGDWAFSDCAALTDVYYRGSEADKEKIDVGMWNYNLLNATWHYNSNGDDNPGVGDDGSGSGDDDSGGGDPCGENLTWILDKNGTLTISGTGAMTDWDTPDDVPWRSQDSAIKKVVIEKGVTTIGDLAFFSYGALASVTIPNSVTTIGEGAFQYCYALTSVTIPNSVTTIGNSAFEVCYALTSVTMGNSVTTIGDYAFLGCGVLTSVTIPNSVTTIGYCAFGDCGALTSVTMGNSVTIIGDEAFAECNALTDVYYRGGEADKEKIDIGSYNADLLDAAWHYDS